MRFPEFCFPALPGAAGQGPNQAPSDYYTIWKLASGTGLPEAASKSQLGVPASSTGHNKHKLGVYFVWSKSSICLVKNANFVKPLEVDQAHSKSNCTIAPFESAEPTATVVGFQSSICSWQLWGPKQGPPASNGFCKMGPCKTKGPKIYIMSRGHI